MEAYKNTALTPKERAADLLSRLSLEEKMGQVNCLFFLRKGEYEGLAQFPYGVGQVSSLQMRNQETLEDCVQIQRTLQEKIMVASPHRIPAIFHMEGLCGAYLQGAASFPSGIGRGSSWDPKLEEEVGKIVGEQERAAGITHTLAPVLDISRDSRMGRQGETYGEDPALAAAMGSAFVRGLQGGETDGRRSEGVAKHFLGFHAREAGIHGAHCEISPKLLREVYAKPFQAAITESGLRGIMPCYCSLNGEPVSASKAVMTELLREEMGFDGVTVSDYCAVNNIRTVQHVCESQAEAGLRAMEAGMDMELHFQQCFNEELMEWFQSGKADVEILNRAVLRVLEAKFRMGLFEHPFAMETEAVQEIFDRPSNEEVMMRSALESLVLLKNDGVLPLRKNVKKIAVIGDHGRTGRSFFGGYTHFSMAEGDLAARTSMAGLAGAEENDVEMETIPGTQIQKDAPKFEEVLKRQKPQVRSLYEELRRVLPEAEVTYSFGYPFAGDDESGHAEALKAASEADVVIVTLGGKHGTSSIASMGEGIDAVDINLPPCQERFLEKLAALGKPVVGVHFNGRPISSDWAERCCGAILEVWNPAEMGAKAIVAALLGEYNPGGKLPVSVAWTAGQIPVYYNHPYGSSTHQGESIGFPSYVDLPHAPRYCFGYGLSYTTFEYEKLVLSGNKMAPDGVLTVSADVRNTGDVAGDEVVQLYVRDRYASMTRPNQELAGFCRVRLEPGEKRTVEFRVKMSQLAFLDREMKWKVEEGDMDVLVGSSSEDIRLRESFRIMGDAYVEGKSRGFYAEVVVR
ncbi:MAG: glycoside hydrolase family 3 N-terminal domain-containing protein [Eubacteriales bacterium]|nr:glycoside hydrolase family 3 N-terminal domain-containing protein [Eubacteriales bacterium]